MILLAAEPAKLAIIPVAYSASCRCKFTQTLSPRSGRHMCFQCQKYCSCTRPQVCAEALRFLFFLIANIVHPPNTMDLLTLIKSQALHPRIYLQMLRSRKTAPNIALHDNSFSTRPVKNTHTLAQGGCRKAESDAFNRLSRDRHSVFNDAGTINSLSSNGLRGVSAFDPFFNCLLNSNDQA